MRGLLIILVLFILSREYIIVNEELLFITSFLLFFYILFSNLAETFSAALDNRAVEIAQQMLAFSNKKLALLTELRQSMAKGQLLVEIYLNFLVYFFDRIEKFAVNLNKQAACVYMHHVSMTLLLFYVTEINFKGQHLQSLVSLLKTHLAHDVEYQKVFEKQLLASQHNLVVVRVLDEVSLESNIILKTI